MKIGILGMGRAGGRHYANATALGYTPTGYDSTGWSCVFRDEVLKWADAIIIATPSECHLQDLTDCIDAGKHVLVEKPIGVIGQSRKIASLLKKAQKRELVVAVGFNLRFHPTVEDMKKQFAHEPPYYASFACCQATENKTASLVNDWLCHEIDLAQHLIGPLQPQLCATYLDPRSIDLVFKGAHCVVHIHSDMRAHKRLRPLIVVSDNDYMIADLDYKYPVTDEHYRRELRAFIEVINGASYGQLATGEDGLSVLRICEQVSK